MDPDQIVVRPATAPDAERVALLCTQLGYPRSAEQIQRRLALLDADDHQLALTAATPAGLVIGWIHVSIRQSLTSEPEALVVGMVVDEAHRAHEIGQLLMRHAEDWARGRTCRAVRVRCNVARDQARNFYEHLDYRITKTQHVLRKTLGNGRGRPDG